MKTFFTSLTGLIIVIIVVIAIVIFIGWSRIPDIIANNLSKKLKVYVEIGSVNLSWNEFKIKKTEIGNPPGSIQPQAFKCQEIDIKTPFTNFFDNQIVIDEIDVNDVFLDLEFDSASDTQGNWSRIMNNLQPTTSTLNKKSSSKKEDQSIRSSRSVYIRKLILTNIDVDVLYIKEAGKVDTYPALNVLNCMILAVKAAFQWFRL